MKRQRLAQKKADLFSSVDLSSQRVYFRMRSNTRLRKSRLVVSPEEGLVVESPRDLNLNHAHRLITKRKTWVLDALESVKEKQKLAFDIKQYVNSILVFGKEKIVHVRVGQSRNYVMENDDRIYLGYNKQRVRKTEVEATLAEWLKDKAKRYLPLRVRQLNQGKFKINQVFVKDQKTIWGSCSAEGNINLNWRLIMAPRAVSDYIIYHELCHTRHLNHSKRYWALVEETYPKYEDAEKWFKNYGFLLHINLFNWL